jgi:hypothetical protein
VKRVLDWFPYRELHRVNHWAKARFLGVTIKSASSLYRLALCEGWK